MKFKTILTALVVVVAFAASTLAERGKGDSECHGRKHFFEELNLTDDQALQLKLLKVDTQKDHILHFAEVKKVRDKIKAELLKEKPDKNTLSGYAKELGKLHSALEQKRLERFLETKKILNKEQFEKLLSKKMDMENRKFMKHGCKGKGGCKGKDCSCKGKGECKGKH